MGRNSGNPFRASLLSGPAGLPQTVQCVHCTKVPGLRMGEAADIQLPLHSPRVP